NVVIALVALNARAAAFARGITKDHFHHGSATEFDHTQEHGYHNGTDNGELGDCASESATPLGRGRTSIGEQSHGSRPFRWFDLQARRWGRQPRRLPRRSCSLGERYSLRIVN